MASFGGVLYAEKARKAYCNDQFQGGDRQTTSSMIPKNFLVITYCTVLHQPKYGIKFEVTTTHGMPYRFAKGLSTSTRLWGG